MPRKLFKKKNMRKISLFSVKKHGIKSFGTGEMEQNGTEQNRIEGKCPAELTNDEVAGDQPLL